MVHYSSVNVNKISCMITHKILENDVSNEIIHAAEFGHIKVHANLIFNDQFNSLCQK